LKLKLESIIIFRILHFNLNLSWLNVGLSSALWANSWLMISQSKEFPAIDVSVISDGINPVSLSRLSSELIIQTQLINTKVRNIFPTCLRRACRGWHRILHLVVIIPNVFSYGSSTDSKKINASFPGSSFPSL